MAARNVQTDVLASILMDKRFGKNGYVYSLAVYFVCQCYRQVFVYSLFCRRFVRVVFYAIIYYAALCVAESDTIFCNLVPVRILSGYFTDGFLIV